MRWSLFLDESGEFGESGSSVVAGLLVEASAAEFGRGRLRQELESILGPGPYPPHAAHLNVPAAAAVYAAWEPRPGASALEEGRLAARYRRALRAANDALLAGPARRVVENAAEGRRPSVSDLREADDWLRAVEPRLHHPVVALRAERDAAMSDLVARVFRRLDGRATVVAALADHGPVEPAPAAGQLRTDAYVRALGVVAERVSRVAGDAEVDLRVLTRNVEIEGVSGTAELAPYALRRVVEAANAATGCAVTFHLAEHTLRYEDRPELGRPFVPALALADWLANRLRRQLTAGSWPELVARLVRHGIAPHAGAFSRSSCGAVVGPLPMLAAAGPAEDAVRAAFRGAPPAPVPPGWAGDQARAWVAAAGRWA